MITNNAMDDKCDPWWSVGLETPMGCLLRSCQPSPAGDTTTAGTFETIFEYINENHSKIIDVGHPTDFRSCLSGSGVLVDANFRA